MTKTLHIIGAGLAGLSCAVQAKKMGMVPIIYEASPKAGGRINSFECDGQSYDTGTHLIVGAYKYTFNYLREIGSEDQLIPYHPAAYDFYEPQLDQRWSLPAHKFIRSILNREILGQNAQHRLWDPLSLAVFNTPFKNVPKRSYALLLKEILLGGADAMCPYFARTTLSDAFVQPLQGIDIRFGQRLQEIKCDELVFKNNTVKLSAQNQCVLALPLHAYKHLRSPFLFAPITCNPILNVHFFLKEEIDNLFLGLIGTESQWLYVKGKHVCATISAATHTGEQQVIKIWQEIAPILKQDSQKKPSHRVIYEKHATPHQDLVFHKMRPKTQSKIKNVFFAGDWVDTGLPATIESAIKSGFMAAKWASS